jgi:hypothetical protein
MNRRDFIRHLGIGIAAGVAVPYIPSLLDLSIPLDAPVFADPPLSGFDLLYGTGPKLSSFDYHQMLNDYIPYDMLKEELLNRDSFLQSLPKTEIFQGASITINL